jgi:hypothetical protein
VYFVQPVKYAWVAAICLAACDLSTDPAVARPETFAYITETILKPSCGTAECHSALKAQSTDVFDSLQAAHDSIATHMLVRKCETLPISEMSPCGDHAANGSYLFTILKDGVIPGDEGAGDVMPLDQPLSHSDYTLIGNWIQDGADGYDFLPAGTPQ